MSNHVENFASSLRTSIREEARGLRLHVTEGVLPQEEYVLAVGKLRGLQLADDFIGATLKKMSTQDDD